MLAVRSVRLPASAEGYGEARRPPSFAHILANFGVTAPKPWRRREARFAREGGSRISTGS
jgi:hypothetical protein